MTGSTHPLDPIPTAPLDRCPATPASYPNSFQGKTKASTYTLVKQPPPTPVSLDTRVLHGTSFTFAQRPGPFAMIAK